MLDYRNQAGQIAARLLHRYARFQSSNAHVAEVAQLGFGAIKLEGKNHRRIFGVQKMKILRHYADNFPRFSIDGNVPAHHPRISSEFPLPVAVHQDGGVWCAGGIILLVENAANRRGYSQHRQQSIRHIQGRHLFGFGNPGNAHRVVVDQRKVLQRLVLFPVNEIIRRRGGQLLDVDTGRRMHYAHQLFGIGIGQRLEQNAFNNTEDNGVAADSSGESDQRNHGKRWLPRQSAYNLA